jgi:hypothetical protein
MKRIHVALLIDMPPIIRSLTVLAVFAATFGILQAAGKPVADIPLLLSFSTNDGDGLTSDGFMAPGFSYDYAHGLENVLAIIQPSGNLRYGTENALNSPVPRRMCVDFGSQFADQGLIVPFLGGNPRQCVNVLQPMHAYPTGDISISSLRFGQSVEKLTRFAWDDGGYRYRIGYGTDMNGDNVNDSPAVRVTCTAPPVSTATCTTWVLAPITDGAAALFRFRLQNKKGVVQEGNPEFVGNFVMPFAQTFTRK